MVFGSFYTTSSGKGILSIVVISYIVLFGHLTFWYPGTELGLRLGIAFRTAKWLVLRSIGPVGLVTWRWYEV